ncbi:single-stranded DNA-binding protein [Staphylococcus simulans]|uniref:single-stranded DNA-binding protein n=1 Tax=Staphylococcus simulans TaxID=1286 RepID=UPI0021D0BAED|nr:single-stranded DNA-binding protein [Staphylococcus simulans]UXR34555.1 single-stranded DNA-binding protein [Staphylococcus simulans]
MLNRVVLVGRLTKDPEFRTTQSGVDVATFTLAVNRNFKSKNGEQQADFINCVVFRKQAENVNNYLNKGSLAGIDGRLQSRSYENKEGQRVFVTEVVCDSVQFLEPKNAQASNSNQSNNEVQQREKALQSDNPFNNSNNFDMDDSSLPF